MHLSFKMAAFVYSSAGKINRERRTISHSQSRFLLRFDSDFLFKEFRQENKEQKQRRICKKKIELFARCLGDPVFQSRSTETKDYGINSSTACRTVSWVLNKGSRNQITVLNFRQFSLN